MGRERTDGAIVEVATKVARRRTRAPVDPVLVEAVHRAASVLADRRRDLAVAEAEHRVAVEALLATGASLRDIAAALGTTTTGLLGIVGELVAPVRRSEQRRLACSFCDRHGDEVRTIVAGPGTYVCDGCVLGLAASLSADAPGRCSFCDREGWVAGGLATGGRAGASLCGDCAARFSVMVDEQA